MILAFVGQTLLGAALVMAALQATDSERHFSAPRLAYGQLIFVTLAFALLLYAHVTDQFSLLSVALHSHTAKPLLYKISGVWGNHEGSMLLWVLILSAYGASVARQIRRLDAAYSPISPIMGVVGFGFLLFIVMVCDPFAVADPVPSQGQDLNPLLQDPSLAIHPPLLYMGYAGFAVPFVFALAPLVKGKMPEGWAMVVRPWVLLAWAFLTLGFGLGSFWAYYELGWGGWWFWDPVENAALMPWLSATALLHTVIVLKATRSLQAWTLFLSILTFSLCLVGTFLTRSGFLTSVHAFAVDPERGIFILILSALLIFPALGLFIWRLKQIRSPVPTFPLSRSGLILLMALILMVGVATVALGTFYPLVLDLFHQKVTVGTPFFQATFVPMMLPLLGLLGLGVWYSWAANGLPSAAVRWLLPLSCLTLLAVLAVYFFFDVRHLVGLLAFMGGLWVVFTTTGYALKKRKILSGTILAHLGVGIAVLGMVGSSLGEKETLKAVKEGESFSVGPYSLTLQQVKERQGPNYTAHQATLRLDPRGVLLAPEKRFYWTQRSIHSESAIRSVGFAGLHHVYVTVGEGYEGQKWSIHAYYKPFINLLWLGMLLVACGGLVAFVKRLQGTRKSLLTIGMFLALAYPSPAAPLRDASTSPTRGEVKIHACPIPLPLWERSP